MVGVACVVRIVGVAAQGGRGVDEWRAWLRAVGVAARGGRAGSLGAGFPVSFLPVFCSPSLHFYLHLIPLLIQFCVHVFCVSLLPT